MHTQIIEAKRNLLSYKIKCHVILSFHDIENLQEAIVVPIHVPTMYVELLVIVIYLILNLAS